MYHMAQVQEQIDITRSQIIEQLQNEISQFQQKMEIMGDRNCGYSVYQSIITRKRMLIQQLSQLTD